MKTHLPASAGLGLVAAALLSLPCEAATPEPVAYRLSGLTVRTIATTLRGEPGGQISMRASAIPRPGPTDGDTVPTRILVEVDGSSFLDHNTSPTPRVELVLYALSGERMVAHVARAFTVDIDRLGEAIWQGGLKLTETLPLPPGDYRVRVLVRNAATDAAGLREITARVPAGTVPPIPRVPDPETRDAWVLVRNHRAAEESGMPAAEPALDDATETDGRLPSAYPILRTGRQLELLVPEGLQDDGRCRVVFEIGGGEPRTEDCEIGPGSTGGTRAVSFLLPDSTPNGETLLRIEIGRSSTASLRAEIATADAQAVDLLWTDLRWRHGALPLARPGSAEDAAAAARAAAEAAERAKREASGRRQRKAAEEYRAALAALGKGGMGGRIALETMESQVLGPGSRKRVTALADGEQIVAADLAKDDPSLLLPVWNLHLQLYEAYRARRLFALVGHSRLRLEALAELLAASDPEGAGARRAADMFVVLGGNAQNANLPASSRRYLQRALALDPDNATALLGLAISHEKHGDYFEARYALEQLVTAHPRHPEARLRLGINRWRMGDRPGALEVWSGELPDDAPSWVVALISQERARSHLVLGERAEALALVEESVERVPEEVSSLYLLAHLYDLEGRRSEARDVLGRVPAGESRPSARYVYDEWPQEPYREVREALVRLAESWLDPLVVRVEGAAG